MCTNTHVHVVLNNLKQTQPEDRIGVTKI
uniref:Uncharacterized protein n=1 Tax=Rhizophora mucronata TaxID=61149 RepID=A0A2P2PXB0_RHIMU